MPCQCDYMEPNERENESRLVCSFLTKLLPRLGLEVSDDIRMGATHEYGNVDHVDKHTALLCYWCENMTDSQKNTFLFSKSRKDGKISGLADWWEKHQEADRKRTPMPLTLEQRRGLEQLANDLTDDLGIARITNQTIEIKLNLSDKEIELLRNSITNIDPNERGVSLQLKVANAILDAKFPQP